MTDQFTAISIDSVDSVSEIGLWIYKGEKAEDIVLKQVN